MVKNINNLGNDNEGDKEKRRDALRKRSSNAFTLLILLSTSLGLFWDFSTTAGIRNGWGLRILYALIALEALSIPLIDYCCGITILSYRTIGALLAAAVIMMGVLSF